ncbi:hypothetical protein, partial [Variovorax sp. KK3]|uniref:hypothetical protein n=1 Tax=Variovorax sp. KK3 TaxID=1855728 RepID=UPI001C4E058A
VTPVSQTLPGEQPIETSHLGVSAEGWRLPHSMIFHQFVKTLFVVIVVLSKIGSLGFPDHQWRQPQ